MTNHCEHCANPAPEGQRFCSMRCQDKPDVQSVDLMASVKKMMTELIENQVQMDPVMADVINEHIDELLMYEEST